MVRASSTGASRSATGTPLVGLGQGSQLLQPGLPEVLEHGPQRTEVLASGPVQAPPAVPANRDQAGVAQHPQVLGDGPEGDVEVGGDVGGGGGQGSGGRCRGPSRRTGRAGRGGLVEELGDGALVHVAGDGDAADPVDVADAGVEDTGAVGQEGVR